MTASMTAKWRENLPEWRQQVYQRGWAIDALEDDLDYSSNLSDSEIDSNKCLLYLALLGYSRASASKAMGWKLTTFTPKCSRGIFKDLAYLQNPNSPQSVSWFDIARICKELGYFDLDEEDARENQENLRILNKLKKLYTKEKIKIDIINSSEEERAEIEELIRKLFNS